MNPTRGLGFKGTESVISSDPQCNALFTTALWKALFDQKCGIHSRFVLFISVFKT